MNHQTYPANDSSPGMQTASLVLGILSLTLSLFGIGYIPASLGILLALLSRGSGPLEGKARTGLILSVIGLCLSVILLLFSALSVALLTESGDWQELLQELESLYETGGVFL